MPQPRRKKTPTEPTATTTPNGTPPPGKELTETDRAAMEETILAIGRQMAGEDFASPEEAQAYVNDVFALAGSFPTMQDPTGFTANPALEEAQDLVYEALETESQRKRIQLAKRALKVSPDCADAWVLLAQETATSPEGRRNLYQKGVRAGERALGKASFANDAGMFWGILETRPYMRARHGLAMALKELGHHEEAIGHYQAMLELNPGDNQGVRYLLLAALMTEGTDRQIADLLKRYDDDGSAAWVYSRALWLFRTQGAGRKANAALGTALSVNAFVPPYLLGQQPLPTELPPYMGFGDDLEAQAYVFDGTSTWLRTPGAIDWLREQVARM